MSGVAATVIDLSRLPRQPGSRLEISRQVPAPAHLSVAMARVVEGSPVELDVSVESVIEGIWMSGVADVDVQAECSRCLDPIEWSQTVPVEQMYRYPATDARGALLGRKNDQKNDHNSDQSNDELGDSDDEDPEVHDDTIDVEAALRDAVVLALPLAPLCSPDCGGICAECGERIESLDSPHDHPSNDPRWAALGALLEGTDEGPGASTGGR